MRLRLVAPLAVVLVLLGGTAAYGSWTRTAALSSASTIRAGSIGLAATWGTTPNLSGMYPGASRQGIARLTHSGDGRWQYLLPSATGAQTMPGLSVAYSATTGTPAACGGPAIAADTWSATQPAGSTVSVCVTVTLAATAASAAQTSPASVAITALARNQPTN